MALPPRTQMRRVHPQAGTVQPDLRSKAEACGPFALLPGCNPLVAACFRSRQRAIGDGVQPGKGLPRRIADAPFPARISYRMVDVGREAGVQHTATLVGSFRLSGSL